VEELDVEGLDPLGIVHDGGMAEDGVTQVHSSSRHILDDGVRVESAKVVDENPPLTRGCLFSLACQDIAGRVRPAAEVLRRVAVVGDWPLSSLGDAGVERLVAVEAFFLTTDTRSREMALRSGVGEALVRLNPSVMHPDRLVHAMTDELGGAVLAGELLVLAVSVRKRGHTPGGWEVHREALG